MGDGQETAAEISSGRCVKERSKPIGKREIIVAKENPVGVQGIEFSNGKDLRGGKIDQEFLAIDGKGIDGELIVGGTVRGLQDGLVTAIFKEPDFFIEEADIERTLNHLCNVVFRNGRNCSAAAANKKCGKHGGHDYRKDLLVLVVQKDYRDYYLDKYIPR